MMRKKLFPLAAILLIAAACSKDKEALNNEKRKPNTNALSNVTFYEYLGQGISYGYANLKTVNTSGGNLYIEYDYSVLGDVSRVKANGLMQLDVNNLTISGAVTHWQSVSDTAWIFDITSTVTSVSVQKTNPVGLSYTGQVAGNMSVTKRPKNPGGTGTEFLGNYTFNKTFNGVVIPPPEN
ncbi:hypothetical protein [Chitinophaga rhizosphaerae]|uniref:hypothetical protein n=1 Tax=Chitinophaga rhizosphaerae TaxID=1864947 RepID=UPI000F808570|nr:hypothetical protein [Chitinophaga rhizosphaerae]